MDERLKPTPERPYTSHSHEVSKRHDTPLERSESPKHEQNAELEEIRAKAQNEAISAREVPREAEDTPHRPPQAFVNKELKEMAYQRNLLRARRHLSRSGRRFSQFVHQPVINSISEASAKTVGRPSGLLGAGLAALAGTSIYYFVTKHYGFEYNYTVFLLLLLAGLVLGWFLEALYHFLRR